ncbi:MAG: extracellular solute-binding protein [Mycoplasmatales bacterium]
MKKIFGFMLIIVLVLSGCSKSSTSDQNIVTQLEEPVEIEFWHALSGKLEENLTTLVNDFNDSQENITVKLTNQGSYSDLATKLTTAGSASQLPTVAMGYPDAIFNYEQSGYLENLTPYFEDSKIGQDLTKYIDAFIQEGVIDGKQYAVPFNKSAEILTYNVDALNELGMEIPTNWDEVVAVSKAYFEKTGKPGFGFDAPTNAFSVVSRVCGLESWKDQDNKFLFNNDCIEKTITEYQTGKNEGWFRLAGEDKYLSGPFANEDILMYVGSTAGTSFIDSGVAGKFNWSVAPAPSDVVIQQGPNLVVFNSSTPEQKYAGYELIKYLSSDEITTKWAISTGYLPVTKSAMESEEYTSFSDTNATAKAAIKQLDKMQVLVDVFPGSQEIYNVLFSEFMNSTIQGGADVKQALEKLVDDADRLFKEKQ